MEVFFERTLDGGLVEPGKSRLNFRNVDKFENKSDGYFIDGEDVTDEIIQHFGENTPIQILIKDVTPTE